MMLNPPTKCLVQGCNKDAWATGLCSRHYGLNRRHGTPYAEARIRLKKETPEERFWSLAARGSDCWGWNGHISKGYGVLTTGPYQQSKAHRFSYELHHGPIPTGMFVCHTCDSRACVNPAHLFLGTAQDNTADMMAKGRGKSVTHAGEAHGMAKLTEKAVRTILKFKGPARIMAAKFGVSESTVYMVRGRHVWKHID